MDGRDSQQGIPGLRHGFSEGRCRTRPRALLLSHGRQRKPCLWGGGEGNKQSINQKKIFFNFLLLNLYFLKN